MEMSPPRTAYLQTIRQRLAENPLVSLLGPRQAGKTTLARLLAADWPEVVHVFDLESPADLARLAQPELVLRPLTGLVILDEVQRRPDLFPLLRVLADRPGMPARFLLLGSASPDLMKAGSESLAGRVSFIDITGFSLAELLPEQMSQLWWRGGFPRAFLAANDSTARQWLEDFRRTFLERDIPQLGISVPAITLGRFWTMVAHYHGQVINLAELARALGASEPTARRYLSGTYVVRQLPPWFENLKKRQVRSPKVYIRDAGLLHALLGIVDPVGLQSHPKLGASWEGFCLAACRSSRKDGIKDVPRRFFAEAGRRRFFAVLDGFSSGWAGGEIAGGRVGSSGPLQAATGVALSCAPRRWRRRRL
jgi:uncharacterized protein